jgi:hypothetical protein
MTKRRLFLFGTTSLWTVILVIIALNALKQVSAPAWGNPIGDSLPLEIAGDASVGQQFVAPYPGLYRIGVVLDRATSASAQPVTFHLKSDPAASEDLWTATFSTGDVQGSASHTFEFEPIHDSQDQAFYFYLSSPDSGPGDAIAARYSPGTMLEGATAVVDGEPLAGNLQFQTQYALRTRDKAALFIRRLAQDRSYLLGAQGFYVGLAAVYALVLLVFLYLVAKAILQEVDVVGESSVEPEGES